MDTVFINSENSKTSDSYRLLLSLSDKIDLERSDKYDAGSNLSIYYKQKNIKKSICTINLKYQLQHETKNLNYLTDQILYQIFQIILSISSKNIKQ